MIKFALSNDLLLKYEQNFVNILSLLRSSEEQKALNGNLDHFFTSAGQITSDELRSLTQSFTLKIYTRIVSQNQGRHYFLFLNWTS